jgi:DNA processing protein
MNERIARAALAASVPPGSVSVAKLVAAAGAVAVVEALRSGRAGRVDADGRIQRRIAAVDGERVLAQGESAGARFVCPDDSDWPDGLDRLRAVVPFTAEDRIVPPPFGLWLRGPGTLAELANRSVAIVGARAATSYGTSTAAELGAELALDGWTVFSGAAYGIDAAAHRGALAVRKPTVAVLACGVDVAYPSGHQQLLDRLAVDGLIVSERPPGSRPTRPGFLQRNRLIAAITIGTVVVEAALRSGALSTAQWATDAHRPVIAIPGPVTSALSAGCHKIIRDGSAVLATSAEEVAEMIGEYGADAAEPPRGADRRLDRLTAIQRDVYEAMPGRGDASVDELCAETGLTVPVCMATLTALAAAQLVVAVDGRWELARAGRGVGT